MFEHISPRLRHRKGAPVNSGFYMYIQMQKHKNSQNKTHLI